MTGWLALVGGAEWTEGCSFDADLLAASGGDEVLVLPTAAAYENPDKAVATATRWFGALGGRVRPLMVLGRGDAEDVSMAAQVRAARFVYLSGGSVMHLRAVLKDSAVWLAIVDAWLGGAVVAGSSAGAMVLGDPMVDPRGGAYTLGLGLAAGFAVLPHANTWSADKLRRTFKIAGRDVVVAAIDERTALLHAPGGTWSVAGAGSVVLHRGGETPGLDALPSLLAD